MTTNDKTRDKLVDSMRKTRAGTAPKPAVKKKRATTRRAKPITEAVETRPSKPVVPEGRKSSKDSYQGGRRVWPD
jgi:hypothetical protein